LLALEAPNGLVVDGLLGGELGLGTNVAAPELGNAPLVPAASTVPQLRRYRARRRHDRDLAGLELRDSCEDV
jgi:hypothetical protein